MTPFILSYSYVFPVFFILISLTIIILCQIEFKNFIYLILSIGLFISTIINIFNFKEKNYYDNFENYNSRINFISEYLNLNKNKTVLIDGSHIFEFYLEESKLTNLNIFSLKNPDFYIRKNYKNLKITDKLKEQYFDLIIFQSNRRYSSQKIEFIKNNDYELVENLYGYEIYMLNNE